MPSSAKLIILEGPTPGEEIDLSQPELVIGRDSSADLKIPSPVVSRRHARLYQADGGYWIEDLGSSNKTFLNGQVLESPQRLRSGDAIQLGGAIRLSFILAAEPASATLAQAGPPDLVQTVLETDLPPSSLDQPAHLMVTIAGSSPVVYPLDKAFLRVGRATDNDIVLPSPIVSGHHARIERNQNGYTLRLEPNTTNPLFYRGEPLAGETSLHDGDILRIGSQEAGMQVSLFFQWPAGPSLHSLSNRIAFGDQNRLQIGRDPENDIHLEAPTISRYHALVERLGQRYRVKDLNSANGTFVNDVRISAETWLQPGDSIRIGPYRFNLEAEALTEFDESGGLQLAATHLNKWVRKDLNILKDISLVFNPREFVVVVGQSGGGKSTLVDAIAGYRPATHGAVLVNGVNIYQHFDAIRDQIGFVPQKDIIHVELSVYQELDFAARLRMPADTTPAERHTRIMEVLDNLDLTHRKDVQISGLSGGQQKRVSIGVELLTKPGLFFLDEPSSGLDPGTETALMHLMRRLADQGRTIILITHATKNVVLADKVVFLARGGYLAWFGPPDEALRYFDQFRSEKDRRARSMEFDEIYAILDDASKGKAEDWAQRYQEHPAYQQHIVQALQSAGYDLQSGSPASPAAAATAPAPSLPASGGKAKRASALRQFRLLSARNLKILTRDRSSLILMLAVAPLIGLLDVALSLALGRDLFNYQIGVMANVITSMFMPLMYAVLVGSLSQMREFVKEGAIYKRERLVNLKVFPYVLSKVWVAILLAIYQAACYTIIHYLAFKMPGGASEFTLFYFTMFMVVMSGMLLGLLGSAIAPNANAAPLLVILLIVPQLTMSGAMIPLPGAVTSLTSTRWAFESLVSISGVGSDVAADTCWNLPEELRDEMDLEMKAEANCTCMGVNALDQESCEFPGIGQYYDASLDEPEPIEPEPIGDPPPEPVVPPAPEQPADQSDQVAMANFFQEVQDYQAEVEQIQDNYKNQIDAFQAKADIFKAEAEAYQKDRAEWEIERNAAVGKAEGLISTFYEDFGWTFVDKDNQAAYRSKLVTAWGAQLIFQLVCFGLILFVMNRKR